MDNHEPIFGLRKELAKRVKINFYNGNNRMFYTELLFANLYHGAGSTRTRYQSTLTSFTDYTHTSRPLM